MQLKKNLTPDCYEHGKSHGALVVKQMADLYEGKK